MIDTTSLHAIESCAFDAWPAFEEEHLLGWCLRYAGGYTKRANCANAGATSSVLSVADITAIEQRYQQRGLPPVFRLTSFAPVPTVDTLLAARGYRFIDLSWVMVKELSGQASPMTLALAPGVDTWMNTYQALSGKQGPDQRVHRAMLEKIRGRRALAEFPADGPPGCCGLGVVSGPWIGLFDIVTHPTHRGQGLATRLCTGLLDWGIAQGARSAYLQVDGTNATAIRLYQAMGFQRAYHYWYRVKA